MARLFLLLLLLPFSSVAAAQNDLPPSDAELRSAYCIPVVKAEIKFSSEMLAKLDEAHFAPAMGIMREGIARKKSTLNRLQSYLLPRFMDLDPFALALATKRGETDLRDAMAMVDRCSNQCGISDQIGGPADDKADACFDSCSDKDLVARIRACDNPSWLPF